MRLPGGRKGRHFFLRGTYQHGQHDTSTNRTHFNSSPQSEPPDQPPISSFGLLIALQLVEGIWAAFFLGALLFRSASAVGLSLYMHGCCGPTIILYRTKAAPSRPIPHYTALYHASRCNTTNTTPHNATHHIATQHNNIHSKQHNTKRHATRRNKTDTHHAHGTK